MVMKMKKLIIAVTSLLVLIVCMAMNKPESVSEAKESTEPVKVVEFVDYVSIEHDFDNEMIIVLAKAVEEFKSKNPEYKDANFTDWYSAGWRKEFNKVNSDILEDNSISLNNIVEGTEVIIPIGIIIEK
jgi:hypothetical protein